MQPPLVPQEKPPKIPLSIGSDSAWEDRSRLVFVITAIATILLMVLIIALLVVKRSSGSSQKGTVGNGEKDYAVGTSQSSGGQDMAAAPNGSEGTANSSDKSGADSQPSDSPDVSKSTDEVAGIVSAENESESDMQKEGSSDADSTETPLPEIVMPLRIVLDKSPPPNVGNLGSAGGANPLEEASGSGNVVFVIDFSGSMQGSPLERVKQSLVAAIEKLKLDQKFTVIFFDDSMYLSPLGPKLVSANSKMKRDFGLWISQAIGGGGTEPTESLEMALQLEPDRIVVLSDGEFDPLVVELITAQNHSSKNPIRIDCIGLTEVIHTLQELAKRNGQGIYYQAR